MTSTVRNKSATYLLPLLASEVSMEFSYLIINTYIKFNPRIVEEERPIGVLFEDEQSSAFNEYLIDLECSELFIKFIKSNDGLLTIFRFPDKFKNDYDLFKSGQYSKMSYDAKKIILKYSSETYQYPPLIEDITGVLWKHKARKSRLEKELGVSIPDDVELASKIVYEDETFNIIL